MRLDDVEARTARRRKSQPEKAVFERSKGWDITATEHGVVVKRGPDCKVPRDEWEPDIILIPWALVSAPPAVSVDQSEADEPVKRGPGRPPRAA
jgi:hypothetical protein